MQCVISYLICKRSPRVEDWATYYIWMECWGMVPFYVIREFFACLEMQPTKGSLLKRFHHLIRFMKKKHVSNVYVFSRLSDPAGKFTPFNSQVTCNLNYQGKWKTQLFYQGKIILGKSCLPGVGYPRLHSFYFLRTILIRTLRLRFAPKFKKIYGLK